MSVKVLAPADESDSNENQGNWLTVSINNGKLTGSNIKKMPTFQMQISDDAVSVSGARHNGKNPVSVARRNARERRRIKNVNSAFDELRQHVPHGERNRKKISKVDTLQSAIEYIKALEELVQSRKESMGIYDDRTDDESDIGPKVDFFQDYNRACSDSESEESRDGFPETQMEDGRLQSRLGNVNNFTCENDISHDTENLHKNSIVYNDTQHSDSGFSDAFQGSSEDEYFPSVETGNSNENQQLETMDSCPTPDFLVVPSNPQHSHEPLRPSTSDTIQRHAALDDEKQSFLHDTGFISFGNVLQSSSSENVEVSEDLIDPQRCLLEGVSNSPKNAERSWNSTDIAESVKENYLPFSGSFLPELLGDKNVDLYLPDFQNPYLPISIDQINPSIDFLPERSDFSGNNNPMFQTNLIPEHSINSINPSTSEMPLVLAQLD